MQSLARLDSLSGEVRRWETYNNSEILQPLQEAVMATREEVVVDAAPAAEADSTNSAIASVLSETTADSTTVEDVKQVKSLATYLHLTPAGYGPVVGYALKKDIAVVDEYLNSDKVRRILPRDLRLMWTVKAVQGKQAQPFFQEELNPKEEVSSL